VPSPSTASPAVPRTRRIAGAVVLTLLALAWFAFFRPTFLGGTTHYVTVSGTSMLPTLHSNDIVVLAHRDRYAVGDIIAYTVRDDPQVDGLRVIHRVIGGSEVDGYVTQGDNRATPDPWRPRGRDIMGERIFRIPKAGLLLRWLKTPLALALLLLLWVVVLFWRPSDKRTERPATVTERPTEPVFGPSSRAIPPAGPAASVRRPIRTPTFFERITGRTVDHYEDVARSLRRRYLLEEDAAGRRAVRAMAFDLAATYGDRDPRFDRSAFLQATGTLDDAPILLVPEARG